ELEEQMWDGWVEVECLLEFQAGRAQMVVREPGQLQLPSLGSPLRAPTITPGESSWQGIRNRARAFAGISGLPPDTLGAEEVRAWRLARSATPHWSRKPIKPWSASSTKSPTRSLKAVTRRRTRCKVGIRRVTVETFPPACGAASAATRSEEHTSELQSRENLVCRLLLEKKN